MTKLLPYATIQNTAGEGAGAPGAAPGNTSISQQQSNPQSSQYTPSGNYPPAPQVGAAAQTLNAPLAHDGMSRGNVPLNVQPTNLVTAGAGNDSLLAMIARGQVSLNQSNYGQPISASRDNGPQLDRKSDV